MSWLNFLKAETREKNKKKKKKKNAGFKLNFQIFTHCL